MPFKKGQSGNPKGRPISSKLFKDLLSLAVHERIDEKPLRGVETGEKTKLRRIAEVLVQKAVDGDIRAIREVADRLDGKPHQSTDTTIATDDDFAARLLKSIAENGWRAGEPRPDWAQD